MSYTVDTAVRVLMRDGTVELPGSPNRQHDSLISTTITTVNRSSRSHRSRSRQATRSTLHRPVGF